MRRKENKEAQRREAIENRERKGSRETNMPNKREIGKQDLPKETARDKKRKNSIKKEQSMQEV